MTKLITEQEVIFWYLFIFLKGQKFSPIENPRLFEHISQIDVSVEEIGVELDSLKKTKINILQENSINIKNVQYNTTVVQ